MYGTLYVIFVHVPEVLPVAATTPYRYTFKTHPRLPPR
jgi:hypothetical protein